MAAYDLAEVSAPELERFAARAFQGRFELYALEGDAPRVLVLVHRLCRGDHCWVALPSDLPTEHLLA